MKTHQSSQRVRLRLVVRRDAIELDAEFSDEEPPSLTAVPVHDTTAEPAPERAPLAKCESFPWRKAGAQ